MSRPATVLALHGGGLDPRNWDEVRAVAPDLEIVAPFLSEIADGANDCAGFVSALARLVPEGPVVVTGISVGSRIAVEVAAHFGDRARGLLLIGSGPLVEDDAWNAKIRGLRGFLVDAFQPSIVESIIPVMIHRFGKRYAEAYRSLEAMLLASAGERAAPVVRVTEPMLHDHETVIRAMRIPIRVLYGRYDAVVESHWPAQWRSVPHVELEIVPDAAHNIALENPELVARHLRELCAG